MFTTFTFDGQIFNSTLFLEQYGPVLSSWSSNGNLKKSMAGEGGGDDDKSIDVDAAEMDEMVEGKFDCFNIEWCISFY